jgi:hypothetical protein
VSWVPQKKNNRGLVSEQTPRTTYITKNQDRRNLELGSEGLHENPTTSIQTEGKDKRYPFAKLQALATPGEIGESDRMNEKCPYGASTYIGNRQRKPRPTVPSSVTDNEEEEEEETNKRNPNSKLFPIL